MWCSSILIFLFALNPFKNYFKHFKLAAADFRSSTITSKLGWCSLHKIPWHTISFLDKWAQTVSTKIQAGEYLAFPPVLKESKLHFILSFKMFYFIVMYRIYSVFYPHYIRSWLPLNGSIFWYLWYLTQVNKSTNWHPEKYFSSNYPKSHYFSTSLKDSASSLYQMCYYFPWIIVSSPPSCPFICWDFLLLQTKSLPHVK